MPFRLYSDPPFTEHYKILGRRYPPISVQGILGITPEQVRVHWGVTKPADPGEQECEERVARAAGAAAGFDHVLIHGNIHNTTARGARNATSYINVRFISSRYGEKNERHGECSRDCFVSVYSPYPQQLSNVPVKRARPERFNWSTVHPDPFKAPPKFGRWAAREQATQELAWVEQLRLEEEERRRREESERRRREESERRRREDSERRRRHADEERKGRRGHSDSPRHHSSRNEGSSAYWTWSETYQRHYHTQSDGSTTWR